MMPHVHLSCKLTALPTHAAYLHCHAQAKFVLQQEALLHGDLHTGSIMATGAELWGRDSLIAQCWFGPGL